MKTKSEICNKVIDICAGIIKASVSYNESVKDQLNDDTHAGTIKALKKEIRLSNKVFKFLADRSGGWSFNQPETVNTIMDLSKEIFNNKLVYLKDVSKLTLDTDKAEKVNELNNDIAAIKAAINIIEKYENKWDRW